MSDSLAITDGQDDDYGYEEQLSFQVTGRTVTQLGRQSISSSITAVIELVKNAYDADAETVTVAFHGLDQEGQSLMVIDDDGIGMSEDQFRADWLTLGTLSKLDRKTSRTKGRVLTGEKGIGRLGLDRLSDITVVRTFTEQQGYGVEFEIDWRKYEEHGRRPLTEITHPLRHIPKGVINPVTGEEEIIVRGTQLVLIGLRDQWDEASLTDLRQELSLLVSPFASVGDFSIQVQTGLNLEEVDGRVDSSHLLDAAEWHVTSSVDGEGKVIHRMESEVLGLGHRLERTWKDIDPHSGKDRPPSGPLHLEFNWYQRDSRRSRVTTVPHVQIMQFLDNNQGIRIYRDHFRVKPYGRPDGEGDWLTLGLRKSSSPGGVKQASVGAWRVGYNQVVGAVFISRALNPELEDQTNREGIVEGPAYLSMRQFALDSVRFFERQRQVFERDRAEESPIDEPLDVAKANATESAEQTERIIRLLGDLTQQLENATTSVDGIPKDARPELLNTTNALKQSFERTRKRQEFFSQTIETLLRAERREKDTLGNLASLGILTITFGHETRRSSNLVQVAAHEIKDQIEKGRLLLLEEVKQQVDEDLATLIRHSERIEGFAGFALRNVARDKRTRVDVDLVEVVRQVFGHFKQTLDDQNIVVSLDLPTSVSTIRAFRIDWESILVNLVSNSVWALQSRTAQDGRIIRVRLLEVQSRLYLRFADSGVGITMEPVDDIFKPGLSERKNSRGDVIGTGMGLHIVKGFVESYRGGRIEVEKNCDLGGAEFTIVIEVPLPRGETDQDGNPMAD